MLCILDVQRRRHRADALPDVTGSATWVDAHGSTSRGTNIHLAARPMLSPNETMRLPPDRQVLLRPGQLPALVAKLRHYADPEFAGLADDPPR